MADQRLRYNEKLIGSGHPVLPDTLNRMMLVEHNTDGTHKLMSSLATYADNAAAITGGLTAGYLYKTPVGAVMVVY